MSQEHADQAVQSAAKLMVTQPHLQRTGALLAAGTESYPYSSSSRLRGLCTVLQLLLLLLAVNRALVAGFYPPCSALHAVFQNRR